MPDPPEKSMSETKPHFPESEGFIACPHCTIQIPENAPVCPHCQQTVRSAELPPPPISFPAWKPTSAATWSRYGKWIAVAVLIFLAFLALFLVYQRGGAYRVKVFSDPALPVRAELERIKDAVVLRGTVTNQGDDIPDLSLRSVGVIVEFAYRDGRREKKTVFPKAEFRGDGSLLRGETGTFEVEAPAEGLAQIMLRSEIVDLGARRRLIPPRGR